jgi:hypothetical protein|tara:strand:+ start:2471 stop:2827 length:357 start_codon:yes stop_codon:yes gene_type:complete
MADIYKRLIANLTSTGATTVFTVPTADVAASPPVPVSTFVVKTLAVHNYHASDTVTVTITHNDGSNDFEIDEVDVEATNTTIRQDVKVFQSGDKLKVTANAANKAMVTVSLLEIQQQQ